MTNTKELKQELINAGVSQRELATLLNIAPNTVWRKVNGFNEFTTKEIVLIRNKLSLSREKEELIFFTI